VYTDTWKDAAKHPLFKADLQKLLTYTYKRAAKAMLVTTLTTCLAFVATTVSELVPISTFGVFAALVIFFNYLLIITHFTVALVLREKFLLSREAQKK
jgi:predicted RND superfamily exporter protein